ncbi:MAG: tetratricopeptide repeat protein [Nitrospirae bacterium]|nr:tetratricopeptide repeat protein [Nitrospirota bacterium]
MIYKHNKALEYCFESLKISKEIRDKRVEANVLFNLAMLYKATGKAKKSANCLKEMIEINKTIKSYEM